MKLKLKLIHWLSRRLPAHPDGHLHLAGDLYMGRWIILDAACLHVRLHYIRRPDRDRDLHDHPAGFVSLVLNGGYAEALPATVAPCFDPDTGTEEIAPHVWRTPGSIALRHAGERHRIDAVAPDTWTLFVFFGRRHQWWGYYTPLGKVFHRHYNKTLKHRLSIADRDGGTNSQGELIIEHEASSRLRRREGL